MTFNHTILAIFKAVRKVLVALRNAFLCIAVPGSRRRVIFLGRGSMHLDQEEARAKRVWEQVGVTHLRITYAWNSAVHLLDPDVVLDIGANYGEVALSGRYSKETVIVLVEANPDLLPYLHKSVMARTKRGGGRWYLVEGAASDRAGKAEFVIDANSSGSSKLDSVFMADSPGYRVSVDLLRLDKLSMIGGGRRILFKLDVEGSEYAALRGLHGLLATSQSFIGVVEMRESNLRAAGSSSEALWQLAQSLGGVAVFDHRDQLIDCSDWTYAELINRASELGLRVLDGADLVVFRGVSRISVMSVPRWVKRGESIVKMLIPSQKGFSL